MKQILICAEGGCCGNFIASLIRTMQDPNIYKNNETLGISGIGSCDHMACAGSIGTDYLANTLKIYPYPETTMGGWLIYHTLAQKSYFKVLSDWEKQHDTINVLHYWEPENIKKFLSIDDVHVIMVRVHEKDYRLVAINKINKNFDVSNDRNLLAYKAAYKGLLEIYGHDSTGLDFLTTLDDLPISIKELLYNAWEDIIRKRSEGTPIPDHDNKLNILYVDDIYNNREKVISLISQVMNLEANNNTYKLYDDYMLAQQDILNYIEKTKNENTSSGQQ
jgi:hypothetical protein